ncbi:MAG: hypothetical protein HKM89_04805 [Gemmatimonadales bacterium]|nr:hypothetical protein [Gemmatimonadales bacterium]
MNSTRLSRRPIATDERGIALAMAVFALVVIGALVAGTFFAGRLEQRTGLNSMFAEQSFELAEAGATDVLANWAPASFNGLAPGADTTLAPVTLAPMQVYVPTVMRLTPNLFFVRANGQRLDADGSILAERTVGLLARLGIPTVAPGAAIVSGTQIRFMNQATISGEDVDPVGWGGDCPGAVDTVAAVRAAAAVIDSTDCGSGLSCLSGVPLPPALPILSPDSSVTPSLFNDFGGVSFDELAAMAEKVVGASAVPSPSLDGTGSCDRADPDNWGEPLTGLGFDNCFDYFPIIYAPGDFQLSDGRGQGVLLVRGNFTILGSADFYGLVVTLGRAESEVNASIHGALMAQGDSVALSHFSGTALVQYSSCALTRALRQAGIARPLPERAWAQVFPLN